MSSELAGVPDRYQRLWTPYRMAYIQQGQQPEQPACPFCVAPTLPDADGLVVHRGTTAFVIMNLYPYNTGHVMVCPYRHVATYDLATEEETAEIALLTQQAMRTISLVSNNDGVNIGMNQGRVAGAGIADHLHQHIVPRWATDANFFPIIAQTKALPRLLEEVRAELAERWVS
ncbi:HIT family protein [Agrococcus jejuensis]|nr:HIT domain-containing protein [Agrococcus jejuensis]